MDCHVHWHAAADAYMEPETFRLNLNSLIQGLRNVTFLLQSQKRDLPSFEDWYGAWQRAVKDDPVMRWAVSARNRIVKQSDLEMHSTALVRLAERSRGSRRSPAAPLDASDHLGPSVGHTGPDRGSSND
jgi:hypothetical protein